MVRKFAVFMFVLLVLSLAFAQEAKELEKQFAEVLKEASPKTALIQCRKPGAKRKIAGSGAVISADGLIITCSHVVPGKEDIKVTLSDGKTYKAKLLGQNYINDYALLKIEAKDLPCFDLGESGKLKEGQPVMTLGFPGGPNKENKPRAGYGKIVGLKRNLPVQGFERYYINAIKTNAKSKPGNSGGPLVTTDGKLIGINGAIMIFVDRTYAIPIDAVKKALPDLKAGKDIEGTGIKSFPELLKELQDEFTPEELKKFYEELSKRFKEADPQKILERYKKLFGEDFDIEKVLEGFEKMLEDAKDGFSKMLERLMGEEEFKRMKEELDKALKDPKALGELQEQVEKALRELDKLFGGGEKEEKKEKEEVEPPEGKELDKEIERMLDLLRKRVQEREKKSKQEELKKKIEKELDEAFGKPRKEAPEEPDQPEQPGQPQKGRPFIGFRVSEPDEALRYQLGLKGGLLVDEVKPGSPSAKAGLKAGDIIVKVGGKSVASFDDVTQALEGKRPGDNLTLTVIVKGKEKQVELTLGAK